MFWRVLCKEAYVEILIHRQIHLYTHTNMCSKPYPHPSFISHLITHVLTCFLSISIPLSDCHEYACDMKEHSDNLLMLLYMLLSGRVSVGMVELDEAVTECLPSAIHHGWAATPQLPSPLLLLLAAVALALLYFPWIDIMSLHPAFPQPPAASPILIFSRRPYPSGWDNDFLIRPTMGADFLPRPNNQTHPATTATTWLSNNVRTVWFMEFAPEM